MLVSPNFVAILTFKVVILLIAMDFLTDIDRLAYQPEECMLTELCLAKILQHMHIKTKQQ